MSQNKKTKYLKLLIFSSIFLVQIFNSKHFLYASVDDTIGGPGSGGNNQNTTVTQKPGLLYAPASGNNLDRNSTVNFYWTAGSLDTKNYIIKITDNAGKIISQSTLPANSLNYSLKAGSISNDTKSITVVLKTTFPNSASGQDTRNYNITGSITPTDPTKGKIKGVINAPSMLVPLDRTKPNTFKWGKASEGLLYYVISITGNGQKIVQSTINKENTSYTLDANAIPASLSSISVSLKTYFSSNAFLSDTETYSIKNPDTSNPNPKPGNPSDPTTPKPEPSNPSTKPGPNPDDPTPPADKPAAELTAPANDSEILIGTDVEFRWNPVNNAPGYGIKISDQNNSSYSYKSPRIKSSVKSFTVKGSDMPKKPTTIGVELITLWGSNSNDYKIKSYKFKLAESKTEDKAPVVNITSPLANAEIESSVTITSNASDENGLKEHTIWLDRTDNSGSKGKYMFSDCNSALKKESECTYDLDLKEIELNVSEFDIIAIAKDAKDQSSETKITVKIKGKTPENPSLPTIPDNPDKPKDPEQPKGDDKGNTPKPEGGKKTSPINNPRKPSNPSTPKNPVSPANPQNPASPEGGNKETLPSPVSGKVLTANIVYPLSYKLRSSELSLRWNRLNDQYFDNIAFYQVQAGDSLISNEYGPKDNQENPLNIDKALTTLDLTNLPKDGRSIYIRFTNYFKNGEQVTHTRSFATYNERIDGSEIVDKEEPAKNIVKTPDNINLIESENAKKNTLNTNDGFFVKIRKAGFRDFLHFITFGIF